MQGDKLSNSQSVTVGDSQSTHTQLTYKGPTESELVCDCMCWKLSHSTLNANLDSSSVRSCQLYLMETRTHWSFPVIEELIKHNMAVWERDWGKDVCLWVAESCRVLRGRETGGSSHTTLTQREQLRGNAVCLCLKNRERQAEETSWRENDNNEKKGNSIILLSCVQTYGK